MKYKHVIMTAEELFKKGIKEGEKVVVVNEDLNIPEVFDASGRRLMYPAKLPSRMVITQIPKSPYKELISLTYINEANVGKLTGTYVPSTFKLRVLTGTKAKDIIKEVQKVIDDNFYLNLPGFGGMVGSDPEVFVEDEHGQVIPAFNFLGSKQDRRNVTADGSGVYWDGFQAEFETGARHCLTEHSYSVWSGLKEVEKQAKKLNPKAKLSLQTVMIIPPDLLAKSAEEHVTLGCMPSFNAYGLKGKLQEDPRLMMTRSAGGHIHLGIGKHTEETAAPIVKMLDAVLGVACVALFAKYDRPERREYYGLAGEYRLPKHGIEYRVLSNAWLSHPVIMNLVFDLARNVVRFAKSEYTSKWKATESETITCINNCDVKLAQEILSRNKDLFMKLFRVGYNSYTTKGTAWEKHDAVFFEAIYNTFFNGMQSVVNNPEDISSNWSLDKTSSSPGYKNVYSNFAPIVEGKQVA